MVHKLPVYGKIKNALKILINNVSQIIILIKQLALSLLGFCLIFISRSFFKNFKLDTNLTKIQESLPVPVLI
jgi:hypothetical protein